MKRVLGMTFTALAAGVLLVGCGSDDSSSSDSPAAGTEVSTGGDSVVKVEGKDLDGLDLTSVTCVKQGSKISIGSAAIDGQQGIGVLMTDGNPPKVDSLGVVVDGSTLAVAPGVGSAEVTVDGDKYTITGTAAGADMKNITAGMVEKKFEIIVTCK